MHRGILGGSGRQGKPHCRSAALGNDKAGRQRVTTGFAVLRR